MVKSTMERLSKKSVGYFLGGVAKQFIADQKLMDTAWAKRLRNKIEGQRVDKMLRVISGGE